MTPPPAAQGAASLPWGAGEPQSLGAFLRHMQRARLVALAAAVLAVLVAGTLAVRVAPASIDALATRQVGTAFLGTATCADWRSAGRAHRIVIADTLVTAATAPDPENAGATLDRSATFGLFHSICSTSASRSALLYEAYNRAASFRALPVAPAVGGGGFGTALHH